MLLIAAVQFINVLDFVMVMPLGSFFAESLQVPPARMGLVAGAYTGAAAIAGLAGSFFLDRFDRRKALGVAMVGLVIGTALGGCSTGLRSLMLARVVAGLFGGPATSLSISIVADVVPAERRGRAMGIVAAALSGAQVVGVPAGLWLAQWGWYMPFFGLAGLGLLVSIGAIVLMPPMTGHRSTGLPRLPYLSLFQRPIVLSSYALTGFTMFSGFLIVPHIPGFVVNNLGVPKENLRWFYLLAGLASIVGVRIGGRLVDRFGSFTVGSVGAALVSIVVYATFGTGVHLSMVAFALSLPASLALRNVSYNTLTSKVPRPPERARFQSLQSTVQHLASSAGAIASSAMVTTAPDGRLLGTGTIAQVSVAISLLLPVLLWRVERLLTVDPARAEAAPAPA